MPKPKSEVQGSNTGIFSNNCLVGLETDLGRYTANGLDKRIIKWIDLLRCIDNSCGECFEQLGRCTCIVQSDDHAGQNLNEVPTYYRLLPHAIMVEKAPACIRRKST